MTSWSDRRMDRHVWPGAKPRKSETLKEQDFRLVVDPMTENREDATERLTNEATEQVKDFVRSVYGAGEEQPT